MKIRHPMGLRHPVVGSRRDIAGVLSLSRERVGILSKETTLSSSQKREHRAL